MPIEDNVKTGMSMQERVRKKERKSKEDRKHVNAHNNHKCPHS